MKKPADPALVRLLWEALDMRFDFNSTMYWDKASSNRLKLRIKITNSSPSTTIEAFEIYLKAKDVWGEYIYGDDVHYYWTTERDVKPGATVYTDWITIPDRDRIHEIECGVKREVDEYGSITTLNDWDIKYWTWEYE